MLLLDANISTALRTPGGGRPGDEFAFTVKVAHALRIARRRGATVPLVRAVLLGIRARGLSAPRPGSLELTS